MIALAGSRVANILHFGMTCTDDIGRFLVIYVIIFKC